QAVLSHRQFHLAADSATVEGSCKRQGAARLPHLDAGQGRRHGEGPELRPAARERAGKSSGKDQAGALKGRPAPRTLPRPATAAVHRKKRGMGMSARGMFWAVVFSLPLWLMCIGVGLLIRLSY